MNAPAPPTPAARLPRSRRSRLAWSGRWLALGLAVAMLAWYAWSWLTYPSDRTPEGAYLRIVIAVNRGRPEDFFAYLETPAQHACFTIADYRRRARELVSKHYPDPQRRELAAQYQAEAQAKDGADILALYARTRGFTQRLRRDLSGIAKIERNGERATVETARGTRYPFRIRPENGIWGLTLFTAELIQEAEKAARDYQIIEKAARDYERVKAEAD